MARKPVITRTMNTTKIRALCIDKNTEETYEENFSLSRVYRNEKAMLKVLKDTYDDDNVCVLHILSYEVKKGRYIMAENKFIANADTVIEME